MLSFPLAAFYCCAYGVWLCHIFDDSGDTLTATDAQ
jgi:hypothetical protein